ncbi:uncharacterized protein LOC133367501 [Rhineura floridana]|uniref:uncharacterized protein LOC133367501 n=1 Tax=Rhineura floridana TaxID=261503 RepID=UPI002AC84068|nr:uncharacterized protein LOC133367501 [Rhineura floridana]
MSSTKMAAVIGGISRLFQPTIGVLSAEKLCQGLNPWYFLIGLRMVTLFFAFGPWDSLKSDMVCQWPSDTGDAKTFCSVLCYNQLFPIPISAVWSFYFIAIIFTVALMKFVYVQSKDASGKDVEEEPRPSFGTEADAGCCETQSQPKFGGWRYGIYIFSIVLILAMELSFIWILIGLQLPIMTQGIVTCRPNNPACPPSAQCALNGQSDKQGILWALAFCAAANACVCIGYLATPACQACGYGGGSGSGSTGAARAACQGNRGREAVGQGCRCNGAGCHHCQGDGGAWARAYGCRSDGGMGTAGCGCQLEGAKCCCRQGNGREVACGCPENRCCPCYFQGNEAGQSRNSMASKEDSEGKLLRGDIELGAERKNWGMIDGKMQMREPVRIGTKTGQGSPGGRKTVTYVAKYQTWGKRRL